jgi:hypothetical protein
MSLVQRTALAVAAGIAFGLALPASAATWNKTSTTASSTCNTAGSVNCSIANNDATASNLTVSGFANIANNSSGNITNTGVSSGTAGYWSASMLTNQGTSGLGLDNKQNCGSGTNPALCQDFQEGGNPEHAFDNNNRTDAALLSFGKSTVLKSVQVGWSNSDTDFTVLAWTGTGAPTLSNFYVTNTNNNSSAGTSNMTAANGWTLVGNYANSGAGTFNVNTGTNAGAGNSGNLSGSVISSSYWLVMAYNSAFGSGSNLTMGDDYFKLLAFNGENASTNKVSEPGVLALACIGLFATIMVRRRLKQGQTASI